MDYLIIKHIHMTLAVATFISFVIRGCWMMVESDWLHNCWVKRLPHVIDTGLLVSAVALVVMSGFYPFVFDWVTAKLILLIAYILLGSIALKRGKTKSIRVSAFVAALMCITLIFYAAFSKFVL